MTGPEVHELAKTTDLAVLPIGSLETHGPHLPNGSDSFIAERVCELIAEEVPCIVLPTLYYNICAQMKSFPGGAISIPPQVMIQLYDAIFSECARLGFRKIFAAVCHGGSETPVEFLANMVHERATSEVPGKPAKPDYYLFSKTLSPGAAAAKYAKDPVLEVGHGGEIETALNMACRPDLVHMDRVTEDGPTNPAGGLGQLSHRMDQAGAAGVRREPALRIAGYRRQDHGGGGGGLHPGGEGDRGLRDRGRRLIERPTDRVGTGRVFATMVVGHGAVARMPVGRGFPFSRE